MVTVAKRKRDSSAFGLRLRALRESAGLTQAALGELAEMKDTAIARLEAGNREPNWITVLSLASALGVTPDAFLGDDDQAEEPPEPEPPPRRTGKK